MLPYIKLATAVIGSAIDSANSDKKGSDIIAEKNQAEYFLLKDESMFPFWCAVAGLDESCIRRGISERMGKIKRIHRNKTTRKREVKKRRIFTDEEMDSFLLDMRNGVTSHRLTEKHGVTQSSCYYYAKKHNLELRTSKGTYNKGACRENSL
jgi:hypothetical protein